MTHCSIKKYIIPEANAIAYRESISKSKTPELIYCLIVIDPRMIPVQYMTPVNWFPIKLSMPLKALCALSSTAFKMVHPRSGKNAFIMKANSIAAATSFIGVSAHGLMVPSISTPVYKMIFRIIAISVHMPRRIISRLRGAIIITA